MNKALAFAKLDLRTIKSYLSLKYILILVALGAFMTVTMDNASVAIGVVMIYGVIYSSYPFALGEKSDMDLLYATLALERKDVVVGRYTFAFLMNLGSTLLGIAIAAGTQLFTARAVNVREILTIAALCMGIYLLIEAVQLPLYFKMGYNKAKFATYLPLAGFPLIAFLFARLSEAMNFSLDGIWAWVEQNAALVAALGTVLLLLLFALSCLLSVRFYRKRDF